MKKAVHAPEIDEGSEIGDVLHHARSHLTDQKLRFERLPLGGSLFLEDHSSAHNDVPASLVELEDLEVVLVPDQLVHIGDSPERDLGPGKERVYPHEVDGHTTLDLALQDSGDGAIVIVGFLDLLPHPQEVSLLLREDDHALLVLQTLEEDLDFVSRLDGVGIPEFIQGNQAF